MLRDAPESLQAHLPAGIRARHVDNVNGLHMHLLEAGTPGQPCLLLLHGFPELAFSWRKLMLPLAAAGYHVIAPDQRGYGRTQGSDNEYDGDLQPFGLHNLVRDACALLDALQISEVACVVGHDFGSPVAAWCALQHPERFKALVLMSAPFGGPPGAGINLAGIHAELAALPRPRKHYQLHYSSREANSEMLDCSQGLPAFLRAYYHMKSADWPDNQPQALKGWSASELARMPAYYIMDLQRGMAETVAEHMPSAQQIAACNWLSECELAVYSREFQRSGFQGGLQWYRAVVHPACVAELLTYAGHTIDVPTCYLAGAADWGIYQRPGELERMSLACTQLRGIHLVSGAGHWLQQEQPQVTLELLLSFLAGLETVAVLR